MFDDIVGAADFAFGAEDIVGGHDELDALFSGSRYTIVSGEGDSGPPAQQALARQLASKHAAMVVPRQVTKAREYPLGFPTTSLAAATTATISASPQIPFRGRRLLIPSDIAGSILINDIKVGQASQFPASNPVPGRAFTELGVGVDLNLDTAQISQVVSLNVTNTSGAAVSFNAAIIGTAVL